MSAVGKTQLRGHGLLCEGRPFAVWVTGAEVPTFLGPSGDGVGLCSCGAHSDVVPTNAARRRWHNEHKDAIRAEQAS